MDNGSWPLSRNGVDSKMFGTKESNNPNSSQISSPTVSGNRVSRVLSSHTVITSCASCQMSISLPPPDSCKASPVCPSLALPWSSPAPLGNIPVGVNDTVSPLWSGSWGRPLPAVRVRPFRRFLSLEPALTNRNRLGNAESAIEAAESRLSLTAAVRVVLLAHSFPGLSVSVD